MDKCKRKVKGNGIVVNCKNDKYFIEVNYNRTLLFIYKYDKSIGKLLKEIDLNEFKEKLKEYNKLINENQKGVSMLKQIIEMIKNKVISKDYLEKQFKVTMQNITQDINKEAIGKLNYKDRKEVKDALLKAKDDELNEIVLNIVEKYMSNLVKKLKKLDFEEKPSKILDDMIKNEKSDVAKYIYELMSDWLNE